MKRILILTTDFDHPLIARVHYLLDFLKTKKIRTKVINISFNSKSEGILRYIINMLASTKRAFSLSNLDNTVYFPGPLKVSNTSLESVMILIHYIFALVLSNMFLRGYGDSIVVTTGPFAGSLGIMALKNQAVTVYEDTDFWGDTSNGLIQKKVGSIIEGICLRKANIVISNSSLLNKRALVLNPNSFLIRNGANTEFYSCKETLDRNLAITFMGSITDNAGLELVLESFPKLLKEFPQLTLKISGDGPEKLQLEKYVKSNKLERNVFFLGRLPYDELPRLLHMSYIGLAMFKPSKFTIYATPLKLFEYMAAGLPIVATNIGEQAIIINESKAGICSDWNVEKFVEAVSTLMTGKDLWLECHKNGLDYAKKYDWDILFEKWLGYVESITKKYMVQ